MRTRSCQRSSNAEENSFVETLSHDKNLFRSKEADPTGVGSADEEMEEIHRSALFLFDLLQLL